MPDQHKQRRAWLSSLKAGDEVVIAPAGYYSCEQLATVDRVTPSGLLVVDNRTFGPDAYNGDRLAKPTPELRDKIEARDLRERIHLAAWGKFPLDTLRRVAAVLDELQPLPAPAGESEVRHA